MSAQGRRYLVTGGTGFIGSGIVRALVRRGAQVRTFDDGSRGSAARLADVAADVELVTGDIRDAAAVRRAVARVDAVIHLAFINGTEFFYSKPELVLEVALKGMLNVLDACVEHGVRELAVASSSEVYQVPPVVPTPEGVPLVIPDPLNPRYSYGGGKIASELLAINYGRSRFDCVTIFRPHNVYGPDMGTEHVIPQFALRMAQLARGATGTIRFPIQGTGKETRAFCHIDDLVEGVLLVIEHGEHLGIYHVGTEDEVTMEHLATLVGRAFGRDVEIVPGPLMAGSTPRRCPDIRRLRALGYSPRVSLEDGLARTLPWYAEYARTVTG